MPRGFFSPSWMISGGAFDVDIVSSVVDKCNGNGKMARSNLCSPEISFQIGKFEPQFPLFH